MALATFRDLVLDCADPTRTAGFWSEVLGYPIGVQDEDGARLDPEGGPFKIWLVRVPEPRTVKNRMHIDINLRPGMGVERLVELGAVVLHPFNSLPDSPWTVLADPEGNEFCAFPPKPDEPAASA